MAGWMSELIVRLKILRAVKYIESRLRSSGGLVEIEVVPGKLTMSSYKPDAVSEATVTSQCVETGVITTHTTRSHSSTWDGRAHFPFWGETLNATLFVSSSRLQPPELDRLKSIVEYPMSIRADVELALVDYYHEKIHPHDPKDEDGNRLPKIARQISCIQYPTHPLHGT